MKAQILQEDLNKGLGIVTRAAATRGQLPVLSNVLIQANKEGITLAATNLELGLRAAVGGKTTEEGQTTIPAKTLSEFVASLAPGTLQLETSGEKLKITSSNSSATFTGIAASEFPVLGTNGADSKSLVLPQKTLASMAAQVAFACAADESRPVLMGVQLKTVNGQFVATATDGFRMSQKKIDGIKTEIESLILPARSLFEAAKLSEGLKEVEISFLTDNNQAVFGLDKIELYSRVLEGNFPDVAKIIPHDTTVQAIVDREDMLKALRAAGIFARENNNIVKFRFADSKLTVLATAAQLGDNSSDVEAEIEGETGEISFNYKFVTDFLNSISEDRIVFKMNNNDTPGVFSGEKDPSLIHLIMPVKVQA